MLPLALYHLKHMPGAGVLLIEKYARKPSVILFRNVLTNEYGDPGGHIGLNETPLQCAQRELFEESIGVLDLNLSKCTIIKPFAYYTVYIVFVKGIIKRNDYNNNKRILDNVPLAWKETNAMSRFYMEELIIAGLLSSKSKLSVKDVYGRQQLIAYRTSVAICEAISKLGLIVPCVIPNDAKWIEIKRRNVCLFKNKIQTYTNKNIGCLYGLFHTCKR